jgi:hypothetical protein
MRLKMAVHGPFVFAVPVAIHGDELLGALFPGDTLERRALKPIPVMRLQPIAWDSYRKANHRFCNIVGGVNRPPWGVPSSAKVIAPMIIVPAFRYRRINFNTRLSFILVARRLIKRSCFTLSNDTLSICPSRNHLIDQ